MPRCLSTPLLLGKEWTNIMKEEEIILVATISNKHDHTDVNIQCFAFLVTLLS